MSQVFVSPGVIENGTVHVRGQDAHHLARAPRCKVGEPLTVIAGATSYATVITAVQRDAVDATVLDTRPAGGEATPAGQRPPSAPNRVKPTGSQQVGVGGADNWGSVE
jgi:16S rRNA U1498 N3-methylase RsmE